MIISLDELKTAKEEIIMRMTAVKIRDEEFNSLRGITMLSAWGLSLVAASFLFLWIGHLLDELLGSAPRFMLSMFFLAVAGCLTELYVEVRKRLKDS
ncbi:MAG: AtpZ/AtpI family protein [Deltaproteobacteria bacterium]|nr:AtpZ/AtpI family protein [Deltaproteobacteria bacterium]